MAKDSKKSDETTEDTKTTEKKDTTSSAVIETKQKKPISMALAFGIAIFALIAVGVGLVLYQNRDLGPVATFDRMIEQSLDTDTFTQRYLTDVGFAKFDVTARSDFSDIMSPAINADMNIEISFFGDLKLETELTAIEDDVYLRYENVEINVDESQAAGGEIPDELINAWFQLVDDGLSVANDDFSLGDLSTGINTVLGQVLIGNFSDEQDEQILNFIDENPIYMYEEADVVSEDVDGVDTYKYQITINTENLSELTRLVAPMLGITDEAEVEEQIASLQEPTEFTVWVTKGSRQLHKVEFGEEDATSTVEYSDYNDGLRVEAPEVQLTPDEVNGIIQQIPEDEISDSEKDEETRSDIDSVFNQLEVYYADFGVYPRTIDVNANTLLGLDEGSLIAPDGQELNSPGGYTYEPQDCSSSGCASFTLTADLSDGSTYRKDSLN